MVGFDGIILIFIVALLLFGPDKLPQYLREMGKIYAEIKKAQAEFERELSSESLVSKSSIKPVSPTVVAIAQKMSISVEGKSEEQVLSEIDTAIARTAEGDKKETLP